jgi:hypothetical protein
VENRTLGDGDEVRERSTLQYKPNWFPKLLVNGFGAICTAVVTLVFAVTKFRDGAWIVIVLIPVLVAGFIGIHRHYRNLADLISLKHSTRRPHVSRHRVILPLSGVHQGTLDALRYARLLSDDVTAVYVSIDRASEEDIQQKWEVWGEGVRLVNLESPYRLLLEPLLKYIEEIIRERQPNEIITLWSRSSFRAVGGTIITRPDSHLVTPGVALQAWNRHHRCALSHRLTGIGNVCDCDRLWTSWILPSLSAFQGEMKSR